MANRRASSLPELGPLDTPGEVAMSTTSSEKPKAQAYWESVAGPSGWCTWPTFKDDGGMRLGRVECNIDIRPKTRKRHQRYFLKNREPQTDSARTEIQYAVPGVGSGQWQRTRVTVKTLGGSRSKLCLPIQ
jgi:hypothetical protein